MPVSLALKTAPLAPKRRPATWWLWWQVIQHAAKAGKWGILAVAVCLAAAARLRKRHLLGPGKFKSIAAYSASLRRDRDFYDVAIVGGGISGAATALHLARQGVKVVILEQSSPAAGSVETTAVYGASSAQLKILGVYFDLLASDIAHQAQSIAIHSRNQSFVGTTQFEAGGPVCVQRRVLAEWLVSAAEKAGASVQVRTSVIYAELDPNERMWKVHCRDGFFSARTLVCADGPESPLARKLGVVDGRPTTALSCATVSAGTHQMSRDLEIVGLQTSNGYAALSRLAHDEVGISIYHHESGRMSTASADEVVQSVLSHPRIVDALGPSPTISKFVTTPLRFVPVGRERVCGDQLLLVGQAAGFGNPITCESLQFCLISARLASEVLCDALRHDDLSHKFLDSYRERCEEDFRRRLWWGWGMRQANKMPWVADMFVKQLNQQGQEALNFWAEFIAGVRPVSILSNPQVVVQLISAFMSNRQRVALPAPSTPTPSTPALKTHPAQ